MEIKEREHQAMIETDREEAIEEAWERRANWLEEYSAHGWDIRFDEMGDEYIVHENDEGELENIYVPAHLTEENIKRNF